MAVAADKEILERLVETANSQDKARFALWPLLYHLADILRLLKNKQVGDQYPNTVIKHLVDRFNLDVDDVWQHLRACAWGRLFVAATSRVQYCTAECSNR